MIEFLAGARTATVTFTNQKHINKIKRYMQSVAQSLDTLL